jgi:hypothetical protein
MATIAVAAASLTVTGQEPVRGYGLQVFGYSVTLDVVGEFEPINDALVISTYSPQLLPINISVGQDSLEITGHEPNPPVEQPDSVQLSITGQQPYLETSVPIAAASLSISSIRPAIPIFIANADSSLYFTGQAPSINEIEQPEFPGVGSLSITGAGVNIQYDAPDGSAVLQVPADSLTATAYVVGQLPITKNVPVGSVTITGRWPQLSTIPVASGSLALSAYAPRLNITKTPAQDSVSITGTAPTLRPGIIKSPDSDSLVLSGARSQLLPVFRNVSADAIAITTYGVTADTGPMRPDIDNPNATTNVPSNYEQCDYSGFRQLPGSLKMTWNKHAVRRKSYESRHPQEKVRNLPEKRKGSRRPEQDDTFIEERYPNGVTQDDL